MQVWKKIEEQNPFSKPVETKFSIPFHKFEQVSLENQRPNSLEKSFLYSPIYWLSVEWLSGFLTFCGSLDVDSLFTNIPPEETITFAQSQYMIKMIVLKV